MLLTQCTRDQYNPTYNSTVVYKEPLSIKINLILTNEKHVAEKSIHFTGIRWKMLDFIAYFTNVKHVSTHSIAAYECLKKM